MNCFACKAREQASIHLFFTWVGPVWQSTRVENHQWAEKINCNGVEWNVIIGPKCWQRCHLLGQWDWLHTLSSGASPNDLSDLTTPLRDQETVLEQGMEVAGSGMLVKHVSVKHILCDDWAILGENNCGSCFDWQVAEN